MFFKFDQKNPYATEAICSMTDIIVPFDDNLREN